MPDAMGNWSKLTRTVAPAVTVVSSSEAKAHLRVEHTADDTYIAGLIAAAEATIDGPHGIGVAMVTQTWAMTFDGFLPMPLYLPLWPVRKPHAEAMRRLVTLDPLKAAERDRRTARVLAAVIRAADLVDVEGDDDAEALLVPFLDHADRLERVARLW